MSSYSNSQQNYNAVFQDIQKTLQNQGGQQNDYVNVQDQQQRQQQFRESSPRVSVLSGQNSVDAFNNSSDLPPRPGPGNVSNDKVAVLQETNNRLKKKLLDMVKALEAKERKGASQASISESQYTHNNTASNNGGGEQMNKQITVYKQMIFQRDEVINGLNDKLAQAQIGPTNNKQVKTQNTDDYDTLQFRTRELQRENNTLKQENSTLQKIQHEQSKALQQLSNDNEYPMRMKALIDELRVQKDSYIKLKDKHAILDRNSRQQQEHMVKLQTTIRELKGQLQARNGALDDFYGGGTDASKPYHLMKADERIEELTRATAVLSRSKDKDAKVMRMQKKVFDKNMLEQQNKVKKLEESIKEKDKEIRLQAIKLKELMNTDISGRKQIIKRDFTMLQQLSQPNLHANAAQSQENLSKLEQQRFMHLQYGRVNPSSHLKQQVIQSQPDKSNFLPVLDAGAQSMHTIDAQPTTNRSKSVNPARKLKKGPNSIHIGSGIPSANSALKSVQNRKLVQHAYNTQDPSYEQIKKTNDAIIEKKLRNIEALNQKKIIDLDISANPNQYSYQASNEPTPQAKRIEMTQKQLDQVQAQIQEADMELGKSEALIEQAANELISKKLQENQAPAFTNAYDEDNDLGIANINLSIPDNKAADSQGQDDGGFDDYALSVGSRTREDPIKDDNNYNNYQPYQNMTTNIQNSPSDKPTRNDIKQNHQSFGRAQENQAFQLPADDLNDDDDDYNGGMIKARDDSD